MQFIDILGEHGYDRRGLLSDYNTTLGVLEQEMKCVAKTTGKKKSELINMCDEKGIVYQAKDTVAKLKELLAAPFNFQEHLVSTIHAREQILSLKRLNELYTQTVGTAGRQPSAEGTVGTGCAKSLFEYSIQELRALCKEKGIKPVGRTKHDLANAILYGLKCTKGTKGTKGCKRPKEPVRTVWKGKAVTRKVFPVEPLLDGGYILDLEGYKFKLNNDKYVVSNSDGSDLELHHLDILLLYRIKYICPVNIKI